ncbi:hypothetical protein DBR32_14055 [Taibaiella sp. KBW10]|uniref:T9SS type A sorting domain-containing protein n=1 Tax=Taibaiella sp. KBW10 TaxID=2153357 RepID=UPI000F5927F7|nr:T9SS type A sorting domain-containing protein [Taibaiella sp. KBW10]RQO30025.1 hypothetical protein DBR32_14055 [Taibaiella sp. KBW10]
MKYIFSGWTGLLLLCCCSKAQAQTASSYVVATAGGSASPAGYTVNYTVGEVVIAGFSANPQFTQGFQEPTTSGLPLPVSLLDFAGAVHQDYNLLQWRTAAEKNNDHFDIEWSTDGLQFSSIGAVKTKAENGNASGELAYAFEDHNTMQKVNYYRLKQVDIDKHFAYSPVVKLVRGLYQSSIAVYPNPVTNKVRISVKGNTDQLMVQILDITGKEVLKARPLQGTETNLDLSALATGTYYLRCSQNSQSELIKIVKQ